MGWGTPCQACPSPGTSEFDTLCPHGAGFTNGGDDINECAQDPNICENGACENMLGGYRFVVDKKYLQQIALSMKAKFLKITDLAYFVVPNID